MRTKGLSALLALVLLAGALVGPLPAPHAAAADAPLALTEEERAFVEGREPLRVGFVQDRIPVSFTGADGELAGISRSIFDRLQELTGLQFVYVPLPDGAVTYDFLTSEHIDLVTSVEYNRENLNARGILLSDPYLVSRKVVVARPGLEFSYDAPLTVAVSSGSQTIHKVLSTTFPNFTLTDYDSITACFDAVARGTTDLMIQNQYVVEYWIAKPAYEKLKVIPVLGMDDELCFSALVDFGSGNAPSEETGRMLIGILNKGIAAISQDEIGSYTIQAIMENQYTYTLGDFLSRYRYAVGIFLLAALVIAVLVTLLLRQRVRSMEARADAKAKGQFLSTMSHEIRTPLNGLIGLNYLMGQKLDEPKQLAGYLEQSTATAHYLLALVEDILDMSRLQEQVIELDEAPVDLPLLVNTVCSIVRGSMAEKGLDFVAETQLPYPCVLGDTARIQQVLMNLLDNARKFTPPGGRVQLRVTQTLDGDDVVTRAEVEDNGRGMSEAFQQHVFDTFAQELDTVSKGNQGTGLGLPISLHLARLMGGDLTFTSQKGKGSCFVFTFARPAATLPPAASAPAPTPTPAVRPRVLVAEDNELNAEIMLELLEGAGYTVELATDGQQALELFRAAPEGQIGVILMDLLMPNMDGYQAAAAIRALERPDAKTVRIIACTANSLAEDRRRALASGMDDFIAKPIDLDKLLAKLGR